MLTQVTARLGHAHDQCARTLFLTGMLHWHGDWRCKIRLLSCVRVSAKWTGVAKPRTRRGAFLWCVSSGCQSGALQSFKQMRIMARFCKRVRGQGWVELGGETGFCLSILPQVGGMYTWQPLIRVEIAGLLSLLLPSSLTSLFYLSFLSFFSASISFLLPSFFFK